MREKHDRPISTITNTGITPACAGKTETGIVELIANQDHPRVCGKNKLSMRLTKPNTGSPPRVREKRLLIRAVDDELGITPACAGKTSSNVYSKAVARDHPRVCGKNIEI